MRKEDGGDMQSEQTIGVFDSGVGGLSVLAHIRERLPDERLIYVADSAFIPYGCKSNQMVLDRCMKIAAFFNEQQCKAMVIACNTATAIAVHHLREVYAWPVIGMEPAVKPAVRHSVSGVVGILATSGTVSSHKFSQLKQRFGIGAELIVQPCPGLVEQIERGELDSDKTREILYPLLQPLIQQGVDTLVLGCTHYPFVAPLIREIIGNDICIIDTGDAIARELVKQLTDNMLLSTKKISKSLEPVVFWSSGEIHHVEPLVSRLWGEGIVINKLLF